MIERKKELAKKYKRFVINELYSDEFTIRDFLVYIEITKDVNVSSMLNAVMHYNNKQKEVLKNIIRDPKTRAAAIKICNSIGKIDEFVGEDLIDNFSNPKFIELINLLDTFKIKKKIDVYFFFRDVKKISAMKNWNTSKKTLNDYYFDPKKYDITDMEKYYEARKKYYINEIKNNNYNPEEIALSYFNKSLKEIKEFSKNNHLISAFTEFDKLTTIEKQLEFLDIAERNSNYFIEINKRIKDIVTKTFIDKLNLNNPKNTKIIDYDGQDFTFLIHKIKGLLQEDITNTLNTDILEWDKHYEDNSYISCSLINQLYISFTQGDFLTLGFNNIKKEDIIAMDTKDMVFEKKHIIINAQDQVSSYMPIDEFLLNSYSSYNEIVLRRYRGKEAIMPDYLVSFDKVDDLTKDAAEKFNIPIYNIILERYALLLIKEIERAKKENKELYIKYLNRLSGCAHCIGNPLIDYFNLIISSEALKTNDKEANEIIKHIKH